MDSMKQSGRHKQQYVRPSSSSKASYKTSPSTDTKHFNSSRKSRLGDHSVLTPSFSSTNGMGSLEIQSNPIQLATRSLSARSLPNTSTIAPKSTDSAHNSSQSSCVVTSHKKTKPSSIRSKKKMAGRPQSNRVDKKGFDVVNDLQNSIDNERSSVSLSPDVHKLLKDISSVMESVSPPLEPSFSPREPSVQSSHSDGHVGVSKQSKRTRLQSKVAANFSNRDRSSSKVRSTPIMESSLIPGNFEKEDLQQDGSIKSSSKSRHSSKPSIPHLNIGDRSQENSAAIKIQRWYRGRNAPSVVKGDNLRPGDQANLKGEASENGDLGTADQSNVQKEVSECSRQREVWSGDLGARDQTEIESESSERPNQFGGMAVQSEDQTCDGRSRTDHVQEVRSLLVEKKSDLNKSRLEELQRLHAEAEARERKKMEKEQRRMAKIKADRKAAIEELHRKREEKKVRQEIMVQEEMEMLQASGKVRKSRASYRTPLMKSTRKGEKKAEERNDGGEERTAIIPSKEAQDKLIDEFFESGSIKPNSNGASHDAHIHPISSTYNEIMDTLRLLEEVPVPLEAATSHNIGQGDAVGLSGGKLQSIISYLDQVEKAEAELSNSLKKSHSWRHGKSVQGEQASSSTSPSSAQRHVEQTNDKSEMEAASAVANDVTATIVAQRLELDSKSKTIEMLQKALNQQRELTVYHAKEMEKEGQKRLDLQRAEYEATVQRHQCFIDQLIDDKKVLSGRCEQLVKELKEVDKKYRSKLKSLEDHHTAEISKLKQVSVAADKLRREKWQAEETQRIKETTVKGLEPEIQRIIAKGKAEIQKLKALHEAELLQSDERASRRFVAQMEEVRQQCAMEKEQACTHERELARQRYEKLAEQEELNYQQQRRRLFEEVAKEKEKLAEQFQRQKTTFELQVKENADVHDRLVEELKIRHLQQVEELQLRHRSELRNMEERLGTDRQAWEENLIRKQEAEMMTKEREMRARLREERDKEIEMVISKLEEETASAKEESERAAEARIRRIREKYEAELREVERSERSTLEKFNSMKTQVVECEGEVTRLRSMLHQRDQEVERIGEVASKLSRERDNVSDVVRQEFADRLVGTEEENKQLKIEMSELRARHKVELERVRKGKDKELEEVHERVKQALEKKEENLSAMKDQYDAALKRADHLQMLLQRQRTELLKK